MGIEIKKRDFTIHRRIGSAAQQAQQTAAVGKSSYRPTRVRYRTTVADRCTHKSVDGREELESLSPTDRKRGEEVDGGGARRTICFVSDIIIPPIFRWQSSILARYKWIEKYISSHKRPFDFESESWLSLDRIFVSCTYELYPIA